MMHSLLKFPRPFTLAAVAALALFVFGCEDDDDFDHEPPAGLGTMYVDNNTGDDLDVFVDGRELAGVSDYTERFYDLEPGVHRLVLASDDDEDRSFRDDIDILEGRRTIVDVERDDDDFDRYDVAVYFED
jgi:hypothetical protein